MVIVMEMNTGRRCAEAFGSYGEAYGDEVLNAGWAEVPHLDVRLETLEVSSRCEPSRPDIDSFMARLYACQE